jgi:hypothetical protein
MQHGDGHGERGMQAGYVNHPLAGVAPLVSGPQVVLDLSSAAVERFLA